MNKSVLAFIICLMLILVLFYIPINVHAQKDISEIDVALNKTIVEKYSEVRPAVFPYFLLLALAVVATVTVVAALIMSDKRRGNRKRKFNFGNVIMDGDSYPSLPRFQFLVWTFVISFVYLSIYLIRIYSGQFDAPVVDNNLLILLGVSIVSPILSNIVSGYKYSKRLTREEIQGAVQTDREDKSLKTMLFENKKPALFRYQMFLWTFVGIFIFLSIFAGSLNTYTENYIKCEATQKIPQFSPEAPCKQIESLDIPKVDTMLVVLMGLSQTGYLGGKIVARSPPRITRIYKDLRNEKLIILGLNFGDKNEMTISSGTVLINDKVVAGHSDREVKWFDTKIEIPLPELYRNSRNFRLEVIIDDVIQIPRVYSE